MFTIVAVICVRDRVVGSTPRLSKDNTTYTVADTVHMINFFR